jgi:hypothetical protein
MGRGHRCGGRDTRSLWADRASVGPAGRSTGSRSAPTRQPPSLWGMTPGGTLPARLSWGCGRFCCSAPALPVTLRPKRSPRCVTSPRFWASRWAEASRRYPAHRAVQSVAYIRSAIPNMMAEGLGCPGHQALKRPAGMARPAKAGRCPVAVMERASARFGWQPRVLLPEAPRASPGQPPGSSFPGKIDGSMPRG